MNQPMRPVPSQPPVPYRAYQAPTGGNTPVPMQAPAAYGQQPYYGQAPGAPTNGFAQAVDGVMGAVAKVFKGIFDFFKRLFSGGAAGGQTAPGQLPAAPVPGQPLPGQVAPNGLTADQAALAAQQGILADPANVAAFLREAQALEAGNALGPGTADAASTMELQQVLRSWGFIVNPTGAWDQATTDAVLAFKRQTGLFATYKMADGQQGVHPFIDEATKQAMIRRLQGQPVAQPGVPQPGVAAMPPAPAFPTPAPVAPAPAPMLPAPSPVMPAPAPVVATPTPAPAPTTGALTPDEERLAAAQGIKPTRDNFDAFMKVAKDLETTNALGPGTTDKTSTTELQALLKQWGHNVTVSGSWDQATTDAMLKLKKELGLTTTYVMADGTPGVHPFVDEATKQAMIKKLQGASTPAATPAPAAPVTPAATPTSVPAPAAGALTADEQQIARAQNLLATRENFDLFLKEAKALEALNALGPGSTNPDQVKELQQVLTQFGFPVAASGQFDQATVDAVLKFKRANNLTAGYKLADGTAGFHPFIDDATKQVMIRKLSGQP